MDIKKKDLNPDLKAIYDRVMNTTVSNPQKNMQQGSAPDQNQPSPPPPASAQPSTNIEQTKNEQVVPPPNVAPPAPPSPANPPKNEDTGAPFLSSLPPRPLNSTVSKPFVFSSKNKSSSSKENKNEKKTESGEQTADAPKTKRSVGVSSKIIYLLGGVFLVVYSLFWLKVFNIF